jgi:hypothetical protein
MPSNPAKPFLVSRTDDPQLQRLNENIARLAAVKPSGDAFGAFALAAHLADLAIEAALELGQMPGVDMSRPSSFGKGYASSPETRPWRVWERTTRLRARWLPSDFCETSEERRPKIMQSEQPWYVEAAELAGTPFPETARVSRGGAR